jgi:UDPglucose 6-dehydrogenase
VRERGVGWRVPVFANPEFLRTGRAIEDFLHPSRVVIGTAANATDEDIERLTTLYRPLEAPLLVADAESAELTKNAANAYLATRISFINELAGLCEATGASVDDVIRGIAADPRIGGDYLRPGIGYGGSCLPKDVRSMRAMGRQRGMELLLATAVDAVNQAQPDRAAARLRGALGGSLSGQRIAVLGLAFKAGTDDIRDSPALALTDALHAGGAEVVACDPKAATAAQQDRSWLDLRDDPIATADGADAVVVATDWPEYLTMDFAALGHRMRGRIVFDARNALDPSQVTDAGLDYMASGRPDRTS